MKSLKLLLPKYPLNTFALFFLQYIRMTDDDSVDDLLRLMNDYWHIMQPLSPNLVISVIGGAKNFKLDGRMGDTFSTGLIKVRLKDTYSTGLIKVRMRDSFSTGLIKVRMKYHLHWFD